MWFIIVNQNIMLHIYTFKKKTATTKIKFSKAYLWEVFDDFFFPLEI
jgi:hypothetical protein